MLLRYSEPDCQLPDGLNMQAIPNNSSLTPKQLKRAREIRKEIQQLKKQLSEIAKFSHQSGLGAAMISVCKCCGKQMPRVADQRNNPNLCESCSSSSDGAHTQVKEEA